MTGTKNYNRNILSMFCGRRTRRTLAKATRFRQRFYLCTTVDGLENRTLLSLQATATTLSISPQTSAIYGQPVTLTAKVVDDSNPNSVQVTGLVTFYDGSTTLGSATLDSYGTATLTTNRMGVGSHTFSAVYAGNGSNFASSSFGNSVTTIAGNVVYGQYNGDNIPASSAALNAPFAIAFDRDGNLYIADSSNYRIREVVKATGQIITIAGNGTAGDAGENVPATSASLEPTNLAIDSDGNVFFTSWYSSRVREVVKATGQIVTVAGSDTPGYNGDNIPATSAQLCYPNGLAFDGDGNLLIADTQNNRIREVVKATGQITTIAGSNLSLPYGLAVDAQGNIIFTEVGERVRELVKSTGEIITLAGTGVYGDSGSNIPAASANLSELLGVAVDKDGNIFFADNENDKIREVVKATGNLVTVAGGPRDPAYAYLSQYNGDGIPATSATLTLPRSVVIDDSGNLFIADTFNHRVREVLRATGQVITVVGTGAAGYTGDSIPASDARFNQPSGVAVDGSGNIFVADTGNGRIREIVQGTGEIITVAGTGIRSYNGDNILATAANIDPQGLAIDALGNIFIADVQNNRIREIVKATGRIITVAGDGTAGFNGDNLPATSTQLNWPTSIKFDDSGNLFFVDLLNSRERELVKATDEIVTVAGNGISGYNGNDIPAVSAELNDVQDVAVDNAGNVFIADYGNGRVREVVKDSGLIVQVAGTDALPSYPGAFITSPLAPISLALDPKGRLLIGNATTTEIDELVGQSGQVTRVVGSGVRGFNGDGLGPLATNLDSLDAMTFDTDGSLIFVDGAAGLLRKVSSLSLNVTAAQSRTIVSSSTSTSTFGDNKAITWTANTTELVSGTAPTEGTVQVVLDGVNYGLPVALTNGTASIAAPSLLDAGSHRVLAIYSGGNDIAGSTSNAFIQYVSKARLFISANTETQTYGFGGVNSALGSTSFSVRGPLYGNTNVTGVTFLTNAPLSSSGYYQAGTYSLIPNAATGPGLANYNITYIANPAGLVVNPAMLVGSITALGKVYDGTMIATRSGASLAGVLVRDQVSYVGGTTTFGDKNVGTNKLVFGSGLYLSGLDANNYRVNSTTITTANITPLAILGSVTVADKVYDGTKFAHITSRTLTGVIAGDSLSYLGGRAKFLNKQIGQHKVVVATGLSLGGLDAINYTVNTTAVTKAAIKRRRR